MAKPSAASIPVQEDIIREDARPQVASVLESTVTSRIRMIRQPGSLSRRALDDAIDAPSLEVVVLPCRYYSITGLAMVVAIVVVSWWTNRRYCYVA